MALHDPDLIKAHEANQRAIALANIPETAIRNFEAMSIGERRWTHLQAEMQASRYDLLAARPGHPDNGYHRQCAANRRATAAALKAIGL